MRPPTPARGQRQRVERADRTTGQPRQTWSQRVTRESNALDLEPEVFTWNDPRKIARSLKRSAETSKRRKGSPYQSAMSMLTFYMNRAGRSLTQERRDVLNRAKLELRKLFGRN